MPSRLLLLLFFFNDTATTEIYTLSLHDALPIFEDDEARAEAFDLFLYRGADVIAGDHCAEPSRGGDGLQSGDSCRSEEHTSELQSPDHLVCRLLLEKKKQRRTHTIYRPRYCVQF